MLGQAPWSARERSERFEEFVTLTDLLLRQPVTSYSGRYYTASEARTIPGCVQRPRIPFAIAASGPRSMRLAARHGELWVTTGNRRDGVLDAAAGVLVVRAQIEQLEAACREAGRDPASLRRLVLCGPQLDAGLASRDAFEDALGRYAECGVTDLVVQWPRATAPYTGDLAHFERVIAAALTP
jgi:alkanesulfonate monooxygenase SsuD/methylene tetrahydromethanopterin reductase-like flavin-dependent oxidoreductase (luciferase family)